MAKDKITEYDATANNNTVCGDVNIAENSALPSDMNNFAREIMSHLKEGLGSGTPLYVDQTNNRVGINKTPTVALDVSGDADLSGTLDVTGEVNLSANLNLGDNDKAIFGAGDDLQIYHNTAGFTGNIIASATNNLYIRSNSLYFQKADGTENNMFAISDGAVSLAHDNNVKLATTATGIDVTGTVTADGLRVDGTQALLSLYETDTTDENTLLRSGGGDFSIRTLSDNGATVTPRFNIDHATGDISFYEDTGTTPKLFWDASTERLGLGTASPTSTLEVIGGQLRVANSSASSMFLVNPSSTYADGVDLQATYNGVGSFGPMKFSTGGTERMRIDSSGRVMIGTTTEGESSADDLTVAGSANTGITIRAGASNSSSIYMSDATSGAGEYAGYIAYSHSSNSMSFGVSSGQKAVIDSGGNLLVSTTSTSPHTDGSGIAIRSTDGVLIGVDSTHAIIAARHGSDGEVIRIQNGTSDVGSIDVSGSSTSYNTTSDHRLKENVTADWDATTRLKQLNPVRFNFIADADTTVDGFLAHEVQSVVPEAITGTHNEVDADGNPVYQGIDQSKLVPLLVKTIQELEARIVALETA